MDFRDVKWRRPLIYGSVLLLLAGGAGAYYAGAAEEPPLVLRKNERQAETPAEPPAIKGLARANESQELRNPFSLLHEREGEGASGQLNVVRPEPKESVAAPVPKTAAEKNTAPANSGRKTNLVLCGIVEGAGGRLALLQTGNSTVTAACGEAVAGWQVTEIGRESVTVAGYGQVCRLPLTMAATGVR